MSRILIVEDEEKIARFVELELVHEGYAVDKAFDGRAGVEAALSEDYDLILLDVMLPQLNGLEVLRRVRDRVPGWLVLPLDGAAPHIAETAETGEGVFSLPLPVGERAVIFGAGHIARALTPLLRTVGFRPVVVDDRPGFATAEHFPQADRTICGDFDRISDYLTLTPEDYVVIMTNGHEHDFQAEVQVLRGETAYVGVIGSRKKTAFVNQRLREAGIPEEKIAFVHTPVGTPIKAVTPEEIAVSIAGEMICVRAARREAAGEVHHGCPMH